MSLGYEEKSSWGDTIRSYEASKKTLPWKPEQAAPVQKIGLLERRTMEREVDPILMKYRDPIKEENFQKTVTVKKKDNKMAGQKFNIITHKGHSAPNITIDRRVRGTRDYNILSHFQNKFHKAAPVEFDEDFYMACRRPATVFSTTTVHRGRDFNILSNKYNQNDEERAQQDQEKVANEMRERYWRTRVYDPIKVSMYDAEKERIYREETQKKVKARQESQEKMRPPCVRHAEGNTYNIINQEMTHPENFISVDERSLSKYKGREEILRRTKDISHEKEELDDSRRLNRISYERWHETIDRGYDPVFSTKVNLKPLPARPTSVWSRLTDGNTRVGSAQPRNLAGASPGIGAMSPNKSEVTLSAANSGRLDGPSNNSSRAESRRSTPQVDPISRGGSRVAVPSLDFGQTVPHSPVSYVEPPNAPPGHPVPMVRTGGLSSF
mmetsp:Transcript_22452/g.32751  ORF Transcript_22452/g.32751 Transcript_22452/m.32751 type:complete len:439 (+) Transcript_22452:175-1491(+)|eukprot:CAMPEP_0185027096 /NCGR_PEP_ID=MMETSP1103-20130426/11902_1 /TAXON_ID=36769 /ORGANISM="Paraphysomonas bandaiensis, Strain Caron Lab Isolate" /LENGTH=438 /DNA_ID=CAMNT_0027560951 /DNA_START=92 /DNA_END=1408 /DNA_ORIENTATION=+